MLPLRFSKVRADRAGKTKNDRLNEAQRLLKALGLEEQQTEKNPVIELSVGQQQRAAVARALIGSPEIVIADEPTSALDSGNRDRFIELLFRETDDQGSTLVFVSHDEHIARQFERVVHLDQINQKGTGNR